jgi:hypothetical protein
MGRRFWQMANANEGLQVKTIFSELSLSIGPNLAQNRLRRDRRADHGRAAGTADPGRPDPRGPNPDRPEIPLGPYRLRSQPGVYSTLSSNQRLRTLYLNVDTSTSISLRLRPGGRGNTRMTRSGW